MSNDTRAQALSFALSFHAAPRLGTLADVLATAESIDAFLLGAADSVPPGIGIPVGEPKKARGRPAKGEVNGVATVSGAVPAATPAATEASASAASTSPSDDPFADAAPAADVVPQTTMEAVRKAVLALRDATDQGTALAVLKKYGAANFGEVKPEVTGNIVRDAQLAMPAKVEADPFADAAPAATAAVTLTLEDVKKAITATQKRTSTEAAQKVVMEHGGSAPGANGVVGPSLKALPAANYAKVIDLLGKLPTTK